MAAPSPGAWSTNSFDATTSGGGGIVRNGSMGGGADSVVSGGGSLGGAAAGTSSASIDRQASAPPTGTSTTIGTTIGIGGPAGTAAAACPSRQADVKSRLQSNAKTIAYLKKCYDEVLESLQQAKKENAALPKRLTATNATAQAAHRTLEEARSKLEDALYVNAHLREENEMIKTDDERWRFQVEQREEQLESLTELLAKLERQQATIDEQKKREEAAMVRRLEEERAEAVRTTVLADKERVGMGMGMGAAQQQQQQRPGGGTSSGVGGGGEAGGAGNRSSLLYGHPNAAATSSMPILPKTAGTNEMSSMLALAPEWTPTAAAAAAGGQGGGGTAASPATSLSEAVAIEPNAITAPAFAVSNGDGPLGRDDSLLNTSFSKEGEPGNDAASAVSVLTEE
eukprot:CAMPEP_0181045630 /NCGR_PEP_ID=MMETSP1070-20121207/13912_1 /TAXON_ID=265543 /ORGANISM="Minutocellus polymorphus, Strain NH13" /LENGTH=397 /DNA_ID=CAMNT_0023124175 /DNA_START=50 /DNA_END=1243 /DNA_ORIENTATION=-